MYWLLYDISNNKRRNKLAQLCKDFGLIRIQKSCFLGDIDEKLLVSFCRKMDSLLEPEDDVCMIPVTDKDVSETMIWGETNVEAAVETEEICFI